MSTTVQLAIIGAIPSTLTAIGVIIASVLNHNKIVDGIGKPAIKEAAETAVGDAIKANGFHEEASPESEETKPQTGVTEPL